MTVRSAPGRSVHVESHFHELRDDALDLLVGGALLHHYHHNYLFATICHVIESPRRASCSRIGDALQAPRFVDDSFEQPLDRLVIQRPRIDPLHVPEDFRFARRLVDLEPQQLLLVADLQRARRARAQQLDEPLVDRVDLLPKLVDAAHTALFSHRTYSPARSATSGAAPCSAITLTSALPTTAASAERARLARPARATKCRIPAPPAATTAPDPGDQRADVVGERVASAGHAEPRDHVQEPRARAPPSAESAHPSSSG